MLENYNSSTLDYPNIYIYRSFIAQNLFVNHAAVRTTHNERIMNFLPSATQITLICMPLYRVNRARALVQSKYTHFWFIQRFVQFILHRDLILSRCSFPPPLIRLPNKQSSLVFLSIDERHICSDFEMHTCAMHRYWVCILSYKRTTEVNQCGFASWILSDLNTIIPWNLWVFYALAYWIVLM